jgi:hypothetical protein
VIAKSRRTSLWRCATVLIDWPSYHARKPSKLPTSASFQWSLQSFTLLQLNTSGIAQFNLSWTIDSTSYKAITMASFIPRSVFPAQLSLPRSYYLGHHAAGLSKMKTMLSSIDLIIECRDYRVPLTSRNPLFEQSLAGRERLVIYTKRDLGSKERGSNRKVLFHSVFALL